MDGPENLGRPTDTGLAGLQCRDALAVWRRLNARLRRLRRRRFLEETFYGIVQLLGERRFLHRCQRYRRRRCCRWWRQCFAGTFATKLHPPHDLKVRTLATTELRVHELVAE